VNKREGSNRLGSGAFRKPLLKAIPALLLGFGCYGASAADGTSAGESAAPSDEGSNYLRFGGYVRAWTSFNLQDQPDTPNYDDKGKAQMQRASLSLTADAKTGDVTWRAVGRLDRERLTSYEKRLQEAVRTNTPGGPGSDLEEIYNRGELRELYADMDLGRVHLRLGKQQVVWGETDFFHPTDLIHGYDYRWRSFLEGESDELRKPLILLNAKVNVPEADGVLQIIVRPGADRKQDIGNSYMQSGGRWMAQPLKGLDFLAGATLYDYEHPDGNYKDTTGGLRWTGIAGPVNYALSWLRTQYPDPVLNPAANPHKKAPKALLGDWFYPEVDVYSASVSGEVAAIDAVLNAEIAFQKDRLFNTGITGVPAGLEGILGPIVKKDVVTTTIRADKQFRLMDALGTDAPSFSSLQIFDTWIQDFDRSDEIVESQGYANPARKHTTIATFFINFPFMNSKLVPGIAIGRFVQQGDTFVIPSISYAYGNHWRFSAEADLFYAKHERTSPASAESSRTGGLGLLNKMDQLLLRATYQF